MRYQTLGAAGSHFMLLYSQEADTSFLIVKEVISVGDSLQ